MSIEPIIVEMEFNDYVQFCRDAVQSLGDNPELQGPIPGVTAGMRKELLAKGKISSSARDVDVLMAKRQELIDIKVNHTERVVNDILSVASKIGLNVDFQRVLEIVARLHDIGRFEYATWNTMYGERYEDQESKRKYFGGKYAELLQP